jgi:transposase InsO family protein
MCRIPCPRGPILCGVRYHPRRAGDTDNAFGYRLSGDFQAELARLGARHLLIRPHCPWQNGKAERFIQTMQREWSYAQLSRSNTARSAALPAWLEQYNTRRPHEALGRRPPISRLSPML